MFGESLIKVRAGTLIRCGFANEKAKIKGLMPLKIVPRETILFQAFLKIYMTLEYCDGSLAALLDLKPLIKAFK